MNDYFESSQQVRREIERSPLLEIIRNHIVGDKKAPILDSGTSNSIYRIGQLESGLWVALRERTDGHRDMGNSRKMLLSLRLESYARRAEALYEQGKKVTRFCVGVSSGDAAALLLEDLTEGGKRKLRKAFIDQEYTFYDDDPATKVYVDLDNDVEEYDQDRYMSTDAMINF